MRIVIRKAANGQYYFTIRASNGQVLATSETYVSKQSARHAAELVKAEAGSAVIVDLA